MRTITHAAASLLLLALAGCSPTMVGDYLKGDPTNLHDYALGETEHGVSQHLGMRPTSRVTDSNGGQTITWRLKDGRTVVGDFDNQGALTEIRFGHDKT